MSPFYLDNCEPAVQEVGMFVMDRLALMTAIGRGDGDSISLEVGENKFVLLSV